MHVSYALAHRISLWLRMSVACNQPAGGAMTRKVRTGAIFESLMIYERSEAECWRQHSLTHAATHRTVFLPCHACMHSRGAARLFKQARADE